MTKKNLDREHLKKFKAADLQKTKELKLLNKLWSNLEKKGITKYDKLINLSIYSSLTNRDIYYLAEFYHFQRNKTRKNFFGRLLCMSIIEFLEDINFLLGKELTNELLSNDMKVFVDAIKKLNKEYSHIKKTYNKELREIRNNASAHKNKNAKLLQTFHEEIPINNLTEIGYNIGRLENYFQNITTLVFIEVAYQLKELKEKGKNGS